MRIDLTARRRAAGRSRKTTGSLSITAPMQSLTPARARRLRGGQSAKRPKAGASRRGRCRAGSESASSRSRPAPCSSFNPMRSFQSSSRWSANSARRISTPQVSTFRACRRFAIPYRMWRAPALDFVVSAGVTYRASDGVRVDRQASVFAAGEIAHLSYDAQVTTTEQGKPSLLRLRAYRSDPDGESARAAQGDAFRPRRRRGFRQRADRPSRSGAERSLPTAR